MKAEIVREKGRVEIAIISDGMSGGWLNPGYGRESMLIAEARRFHKELGDLIKKAEQMQRPGVRKLGEY